MNKYRNIKTEVDGIKFDSKKEARRYSELKLLEKTEVISELVLQPKFPIRVEGVKVCVYIADFAYKENHKFIVEDCKGMKTSVYNLKKKLMWATHDIIIRET